MKIRNSTLSDLKYIMPVYETAKVFMRRQGNMAQWVGGYPSEEVIITDIKKGNHYVCYDNFGNVMFVFTFIIGADPTYALIEDGEWIRDTPYGTIHRIASSGIMSGVVKKCVDYCFSKIDNIRIDTHADNSTMLNALAKLAFIRCGIIFTDDGSPRIAFQKIRARSQS